MRTSLATVVALSVSALVIVAAAVALGYPRLTGGDRAADPACVITFDSSGKQTWVGLPPPALEAAANTLQALVGEHPDQLSVAAICSDLSGLALYGSADSLADIPEAAHDVAALGVNVTYIHVRYSQAELDRRADTLFRQLEKTGKPFTGGPDYQHGRLIITPVIDGQSNTALLTQADIDAANVDFTETLLITTPQVWASSSSEGR